MQFLIWVSDFIISSKLFSINVSEAVRVIFDYAWVFWWALWWPLVKFVMPFIIIAAVLKITFEFGKIIFPFIIKDIKNKLKK